MKHLILARIFGAILLLATSLSGYQASASNDPIVVTIRGLDLGDKATLTLASTAPDSRRIISEETVVGEGKGDITVNIANNLKDGNYELAITTPAKYFRDPKAYWFIVLLSNIVNSGNKPILFNLLPAAETKMLEGILILDAQKQPKGGNSILTPGTYHYAGPYTYFDNQGVWGRFAVTNPSVNHSLTSGYVQFVADRVYAGRIINSSQHWMEIGWIEHSSYGDTRWMYHCDNTIAPSTWRYDLPTGNTLEVRVLYLGDNVWGTEYYDGNDWQSVRSVDLGMTSADWGENALEVYTWTSDDDHPNVPQTTTDVSQLNSGGSWSNWSTYYSTWEMADSPYDAHYSTKYTSFYTHKH